MDFWVGFWLGVVLALCICALLFFGLHYLCKE
jgi:hypothetical protein